MLAFGAVFEMPVILVLLARVGVIDDRFLRRNRSYAIVILAVVAAVITPSQDAFSMLAMLFPLVVLYETSIISRGSCRARGRRWSSEASTPTTTRQGRRPGAGD